MAASDGRSGALADKLAILGRFPLFEPLSDAQRERLAEACRLRAYTRGATLFHEGAPAEGMFIVLSGVVKVVRFNSDGRETVLHLIRPGNTLAEASAFWQGSYPASAQALGRMEALFIPSRPLCDMIRENPDLALRMLGVLSLRLRMFTQKLAVQGQVDAMRRLSLYLVHRCQIGQGSTEIHLDASREVLGNLLGVTRETLCRQLSRLSELGVIDIRGRVVDVLDPKRLRELADGTAERD